MIRDCSTFPFLDQKFIRFCFMMPEDNDKLLDVCSTNCSKKQSQRFALQEIAKAIQYFYDRNDHPSVTLRDILLRPLEAFLDTTTLTVSPD